MLPITIQITKIFLKKVNDHDEVILRTSLPNPLAIISYATLPGKGKESIISIFGDIEIIEN